MGTFHKHIFDKNHYASVRTIKKRIESRIFQIAPLQSLSPRVPKKNNYSKIFTETCP